MTRTTWIAFVLVCVAILGGLIYTSQQDKVDVGDVETQSVQQPSQASGEIGDHIYGNKDAKVTIIEYGDYQCPGCASAAPNLKSIVDNQDGKVNLIFRNFPLSMHPNARAAAAAAEAAGLQDKYWEMHDHLYKNQQTWSSYGANQRTDEFASYARELGLDVERWKSDLEKPSIIAKINYDLALGKKSQVSGTPAIFVDGKLIDMGVKDGQLVGKGTADSQPVWANQAAFDKLIIQPALEKAQ